MSIFFFLRDSTYFKITLFPLSVWIRRSKEINYTPLIEVNHDMYILLSLNILLMGTHRHELHQIPSVTYHLRL